MLQLLRFLDSDYFSEGAEVVSAQPKVWRASRWIPLGVLHVSCLLVIWTGCSATALGWAVFLYFFRMFAITAFYHRYFSHRTFSTSRIAQFVFALWGCLSMQRGPLWWASHHRHHHNHADDELDVHSPTVRGFIWSHIGWIACDANMPTDYSRVKDFSKFPELRMLNRVDWLPPFLLGAFTYAMGEYLKYNAPQLHTNGLQMLAWGLVSTVVLFHCTAMINSIAHQVGYRTYDTSDDSKNNFLLALVTMGEGWHNNHHRYPGLVRQGLLWWQVDTSYYLLLLMEKLGIIWNLHKEPKKQLAQGVEAAPAPIPLTVQQ